jgi:hypothetical protein
LLVEFLTNPGQTTSEAIRRNHGDATMLSEVVSKSYKKGDRNIFVTLLTIKKREDDGASLTGKLEIENIVENKDGISLVYNGSEKVTIINKLNLEYGIDRYEEDRAPAYDWDSGKINYGAITTDSDFAFIIESKKIKFGFINGCRLYYNEKEVYKAPRYTSRDFLLEKFREIDHKWRAWSGEIE